MNDAWYRRLCGFLTTHRWRKMFGGSIRADGITEHYYVCRICGKHIAERVTK